MGVVDEGASTITSMTSVTVCPHNIRQGLLACLRELLAKI